MRQQYHLRPADPGVDAWDVHRLIELSQGLPIHEVDIGSIAELDEDHWFFPREQPPTVREIVEHTVPRAVCATSDARGTRRP